MSADSSPRVPRPLEYHRAVVRHLRETEPEVWAWASSVRAVQDHADAVQADLLRNTYRLTAQSHPDAVATGTEAATRLGLPLPLTLYQGGDGPMNASIFFVPEEAHVVLFGPVLERLTRDELLALLGHELSHHLLWTAEDGAFHTADRVLRQTAGDPTAAVVHGETARRYSLYTEIYADRGAALAAGGAGPAISTLVKVQTGLHTVDANTYLEQAREVNAREAKPSQEHSHPESFLRAHAVDAWWRADEGLDAWLVRRIEGPLSMQGLDVVAQGRLRDLCRRFIVRVTREPRFSNERTATQARAYFADFSESEPALDLEALRNESIDTSVRDFLCAVLLDFALVDPDIREDALPDAGRLAVAIGAEEQMQAALRRHLGMNKRAVDKLSRQWAKGTPA